MRSKSRVSILSTLFLLAAVAGCEYKTSGPIVPTAPEPTVNSETKPTDLKLKAQGPATVDKTLSP